MTTTMTMMIAMYVVVVVVDDDYITIIPLLLLPVSVSPLPTTAVDDRIQFVVSSTANSSSDYPSSCSSPYTSMPLPSLSVFLLSSLSIPPLPAFELFLCSRIVVTTTAANAAATTPTDDEYHICRPLLRFCCRHSCWSCCIYCCRQIG